MVSRLPREILDHNLLILSSRSINNLPCIQFRFDLGWLKNPDFYPLVQKIWEKPCRAKSALDKIQQKLKLCKQYLKGWGFSLQGEMRKRRKEFQKEIADLEKSEEEVTLNSIQIEKLG